MPINLLRTEAAAAQWAAIVEFSEDAIIGKDLNGIVTSWNRGAEKLFGCAADEMVGQPITRLIPDQRRQEEVEILSRVQRGESVQHFDTERLRKDGSLVAISVTVSPIKDSTGKIIGASKVARDITERKRINEQLNDSFKEIGDLKTALDEHAIVAITDPQGKITYVNDKFCAISKYSREELLGQDHRIINSGHHPKEFIRHLWTTIANGRVWHGEIKNKAKDGSFYWVDTTIVPFLDQQGKPRQYVAIRADITERKRVEEELRQSHENLERTVAERTAQLQLAKERAEAAGRAKSEFMASMSHELRTPLNGIIGFSEFLVDGKPGALNPKQKEYLQDILNSGRHLLQLINDVLDLAKVEAGKIELIPEVFALGKAIGEVCSVAGPIAQKKQIIVGVSIAPELTEVMLDQMRFKQVVYNLLSNALKFTDGGGRVEIHCAANGSDSFKLAVKDTGIGIKAEDLTRLFKEFEQIESGAARRYEGTGLGLALTRKIVEMQGGCINVSSEVGKGTTFTVILPLSFGKALA
jgi:PAS domain S-box-containing protein